MFSRFLLFGAVSTFLCVSLPAHAAASTLAGAPDDSLEHFPPIKLRAYGTLSGEGKTIAGSPQSSVLLITCESEPKAQLVLAKYLSDLGLLPGVTPLPLTTGRGPIAAHKVEKQGVIAAARCGRQVYIFTAADGAALEALVAANLPATDKVDATEAEVPVPMYLDRWDKYGFRFYYGPLLEAAGQRTTRSAELRSAAGFHLRRQTGKDGLVVWNSPFGAATADGIFDTTSREWVYKAAQAVKLPARHQHWHHGPKYRADKSVSRRSRAIRRGYTSADGITNRRKRDSDPGLELDRVAGSGAWPAQEPGERPQYGKYDNIVNWLEPHEETSHGVADQLDDHGADAKKSFYAFLKTKYGTAEAVGRRYGAHYKSWHDVPFTEMATCFGWNDDAINLAGLWKISSIAPYEASSAGTGLDDSSWASIETPENAHNPLDAEKTDRVCAVISRSIRRGRRRIPRFISICGTSRIPCRARMLPATVFVYVNGRLIPENPPGRTIWHWCGLDITAALHDGDNLITYYLPDGMIIYRSYLSGTRPAFTRRSRRR
jgi:hypothetical protein